MIKWIDEVTGKQYLTDQTVLPPIAALVETPDGDRMVREFSTEFHGGEMKCGLVRLARTVQSPVVLTDEDRTRDDVVFANVFQRAGTNLSGLSTLPGVGELLREALYRVFQPGQRVAIVSAERLVELEAKAG